MREFAIIFVGWVSEALLALIALFEAEFIPGLAGESPTNIMVVGFRAACSRTDALKGRIRGLGSTREACGPR